MHVLKYELRGIKAQTPTEEALINVIRHLMVPLEGFQNEERSWGPASEAASRARIEIRKLKSMIGIDNGST